MKEIKIGDLVIPIPIIQGGMGVGVSLSGLAAAVANEGGVGVISCAGLGLLHRSLDKDYVKACVLGLKLELKKAKEKTLGVIGVNIMVALSNFDDMVRTSIEEKVDILFVGAGLPLDLPKFLKHDTITKLVPIVSSGKAARVLCAKWKSNYDYLPDAIVVEGPKAGGHLGFRENQLEDENFSLERLVPDVVSEVAKFEELYGKSIPVIAGGGLYNGEDIYKIINNSGAAGVQLGSRFVTTDECDASVEFKNQYLKAEENDVDIIKSPVGMPGRAIYNDFLRNVKLGIKSPVSCPFKCLKTCKVEKSPYCIILALYNAAKGDLKKGYVFAGVNAYREKKIISVKELFSELVDGYKSFKNSL